MANLDWWFDQNPVPKLWVRGSPTDQDLPAPTYQNVGPEGYDLDSESMPAHSVTSEDATTVREDGAAEESNCTGSEDMVESIASHEEGYMVVHTPDDVFEMIMNYASGAATPPTSTAAEWGSGSGHSLATDFDMLDRSQSLSEILRDTGTWMPSLHPPFLSNCQHDYPTSSFWRVTISRAASSPTGTLYPTSLCIVAERLSKSMP